MVKRQQIPVKIRRQILIETGHRCAIPTCRNTANVDVHHIVPWAKNKKHDPENLIALCPNCHKLADDKRIDNKSLKKYKEICLKLISPPYPHPVNDIKAYIKFNPNTVTEILDSYNIESLSDCGILNFSFTFDKPFEDINYVVNATGTGSVTFKVFRQESTYINIIFDEPCPDIVRLSLSTNESNRVP